MATLNFNKDDLNIQEEGKSNLEATYKAVVEFIKWYNNKK